MCQGSWQLLLFFRAVLKLFIRGNEKAAQVDIKRSVVSQKKQEIRSVARVLHTLCFAKHHLHHAIYCIQLEYQIPHFHSLTTTSHALTFLGLIFCSFLKPRSMKRLVIIMVTVLCSRKRLCHLKLLPKTNPQPKNLQDLKPQLWK